MPLIIGEHRPPLPNVSQPAPLHDMYVIIAHRKIAYMPLFAKMSMQEFFARFRYYHTDTPRTCTPDGAFLAA